MTITPQSHPLLFVPVEVAGYNFFYRKNSEGITVGLREDLDAVYEDAYRSSQGVEGPIDDAAFAAWKATPRGAHKCDTAAAKLVFIPATPDTPPMEGDVLRWLSQDELVKALGFFTEPAPNKPDEPSASIDSSSPVQNSSPKE